MATVCAGAVIRDASGRLLLVQRANEPGRGLWSLPGGRVEDGETPAEACVREVREETGLEVSVGELLGQVTIGDYDVRDFACDVVGGQLSAGDDALDARWCDVDEVLALPLTAGLVAELRKMGVEL